MMEQTQKNCGGCTNTSCDAAPEKTAPAERLKGVKRKILVLSGKGGVGKSSVAANLAISLSLAGKRVGLLDVDIHGPSIPKLLGVSGSVTGTSGDNIVPVVHEGIKVMSIGFLLESRETALIWRGPLKMGVIRQFLDDVTWGALDVLIIDCPPGTGDEPLSVVQLIPPVLGVIENMSGFVCPKCGEVTDIFKAGGGERMASEMDVPFLGRIPMDQQMVEAADAGRPYVAAYPRTETAQAFGRVVRRLLERDPEAKMPADSARPGKGGGGIMRIAIPTAEGRLAMHFGHCQAFLLFDVDTEKKTILKSEQLAPPAHEPGVLPRWLAEQGANLIIAGGMGMRAQQLFEQQNIAVTVGASAERPEDIVQAYLEGTLQTGDNVCDH